MLLYSDRLSQAVAGLLLALFVCATAATPSAQTSADADSLDALFIDFAVPDLAAFTLLGVDGSQISRPGTVRELSVALANGLNADGIPEQGTGLEFAPFRVLEKPQTLRAYRKNARLFRLTLSAATVRNADSTQFGFGFRWVPFDAADPYTNRALEDAIKAALAPGLKAGVDPVAATDFLDEFAIPTLFGLSTTRRDTLLKVFELDEPALMPKPFAAKTVIEQVTAILNADGETLSATQEEDLRALAERYIRLVSAYNEVDADLEQAVKARKKAFRDSMWNARSFQIAGGVTLLSSDSTDGFDESTLSGFAGYAQPLGRYGQLIAHAQLRLPLYADDEASSDAEDLQVSLGGRLLLGNATQRLSLEGLWGRNDTRLGDDDAFRITVGAEFRIAENAYLELATGMNLSDGGKSSFITLGGLKYALRKDRRFASP